MKSKKTRTEQGFERPKAESDPTPESESRGKKRRLTFRGSKSRGGTELSYELGVKNENFR